MTHALQSPCLQTEVLSPVMARTGGRLIQSRTRQPTTGGLGVHFVSPVKRRDKRKSSTIVHIPGHLYKRQALLDEIAALMHQASRSHPPGNFAMQDHDSAPIDTAVDGIVNPCEAIDVDWVTTSESPDAAQRRILGNEACSLYDRWKDLLPSLVGSLLSYDKASIGSVFQPTANIICSCSALACSKKVTQMTALYFDRRLSLQPCGYKSFIQR
jgi:hypothetical protein